MNKGFSVASVVLSFFLVGGGLLVGILVAALVKANTPVVMYATVAGGAFLGGFIAARASMGSTIVEPVIGALLVVGTLVFGIYKTPLGPLFLSIPHDQLGKGIAIFAGLTAGGALVGAFLSEKIMGDATDSSAPWFLYAAMSSLGATFFGLVVAMLLMLRGDAGTTEKMTAVFAIATGVGCLLSGLAVGSSAKARPILANLLGTAGGVFAFFFVGVAQNARAEQDAIIGAAVFAIGGAIVSTIGVALGWNIVGKNNA